MHVGGRVIRTTDEHPFWIVDRGWTPVRDLNVGDKLITDDGRQKLVEDLHETGQWETVYNLRVSDYHTYFVGCAEWGFAVWAHNAAYEVLDLTNGEFALVKKGHTTPIEPIPGEPIRGKSVDEVMKLADKYGIERSEIAPKTKIKPYADPTRRPAYGEGQVEEVWKNAQDAEGRVFDPNPPGPELFWDKTIDPTTGKPKPRDMQWDMGHITNQKYKQKHKDYMDGKIDLEEFLDWYRDPKNYQPERPGSNRSRKHD